MSEIRIQNRAPARSQFDAAIVSRARRGYPTKDRGEIKSVLYLTNFQARSSSLVPRTALDDRARTLTMMLDFCRLQQSIEFELINWRFRAHDLGEGFLFCLGRDRQIFVNLMAEMTARRLLGFPIDWLFEFLRQIGLLLIKITGAIRNRLPAIQTPEQLGNERIRCFALISRKSILALHFAAFVERWCQPRPSIMKPNHSNSGNCFASCTIDSVSPLLNFVRIRSPG